LKSWKSKVFETTDFPRYSRGLRSWKNNDPLIDKGNHQLNNLHIIDVCISFLELVGCKVFPVCTAYVVTLKINRNSICQQIYVLKGSKFKFQIVVWILYNSCHDNIATFSYKIKQNSDEIALINKRCKQRRRLGDLIYK